MKGKLTGTIDAGHRWLPFAGVIIETLESDWCHRWRTIRSRIGHDGHLWYCYATITVTRKRSFGLIQRQ